MIKFTESLEVAWNVVNLVMAKSIGSPELAGFITPFLHDGFVIHGTYNHLSISEGIILRKVAVGKHAYDDSIMLWYMEGANFNIDECEYIRFPKGAYDDASNWIIRYLESGEDSAGVLVEA